MELTDYLHRPRLLARHRRVRPARGLSPPASASRSPRSTRPTPAASSAPARAATREASVGDSLASRGPRPTSTSPRAAPAQDVISRPRPAAGPGELIGRITVTQPLDVLIKISARAGTRGAAARRRLGGRARQAGPGRREPDRQVREQSLRIVPIEAAELPGAPASPNTRNLALGFVLGLMLGLGYAVLRSQLDRRIRTAEQEVRPRVRGRHRRGRDPRDDRAGAQEGRSGACSR